MVSTVSLELDPQAFRDLLMGRKKKKCPGAVEGKAQLYICFLDQGSLYDFGLKKSRLKIKLENH